MYSKTLTFTSANLNAHGVLSGTVPIYYMSSGMVGGGQTKTMFPRVMQFTNGTGQSVSIGLIRDDSQMAEYQKSSANFTLIPIANGVTWDMSKLMPMPLSTYILVQCPSGSTSNDLVISFMNFA